MLEHARKYPDLVFETVFKTDDYAEQRGLEQIVYDAHPEADLNRLRGVDPRNVKKAAYYARKLLSSSVDTHEEDRGEGQQEVETRCVGCGAVVQ